LTDESRAEFEALARRRVPSRARLWTPAGTGTAGAQLPAQVTRLIGRERELIVLLSAMKDATKRLITLTGPGGIGKTRLAIEAAALTSAEFADGVFFVSLGAERDPGHVASSIVAALGITGAHEPLVDALGQWLSDRRCLIVLDTFEHIIDGAPMVAELLAGSPGVKIVVTSREPLHLRGEHDFPVPTLALPPDDKVLAGQLSWYPATVLFVERARSVKPNLVIDDAAAAMIADLARRLDGLPLAIELAAARLRHMPLTALRDHLDQRLSLLTGGPRDLPPRQQTMRDTIAWSYDLLDPTEQSVFRHLAVFAGATTLDSARLVSAPEQAIDGLLTTISALVDKSLVWLSEADTEAPRYRMLDVIRDFAVERLLELGEAELAFRRHADTFLALAEEAADRLGTADEASAFQRLGLEHDNIRAALRWAIEQRNAELALGLGGTMWQFWRSHGDLAEGRQWLRAALDIDPSSAPNQRAKALWGAAGLAYHHGDYADAERLCAELLPLAKQLGQPLHMRNALTIQGVVAMTQRQFKEAVGPLTDAVEIARSLGPSWLLGTSLLNLGAALLHSGNTAGARTNLEEALGTYEQIGDAHFVARAQEQLGYIALHAGDQRLARSLFRSALQAFIELDDRWGLGEALEGFSVLAAVGGEPERAARLAGAAESFRLAFGARTLPGDRETMDGFLGAAHASLGDDAWRSGLEIGRELSFDDAMALALEGEIGKESS
jgi:predicted ATPase